MGEEVVPLLIPFPCVQEDEREERGRCIWESIWKTRECTAQVANYRLLKSTTQIYTYNKERQLNLCTHALAASWLYMCACVFVCSPLCITPFFFHVVAHGAESAWLSVSQSNTLITPTTNG